MGAKFSKRDLCSFLKAESIGGGEDLCINGAEFDTRRLIAGQLFAALPGSHAHGHEYLDLAFSKGAALALVEDKSLLSSSQHGQKLLYVENTLKAMSALARVWRERLSYPIIGVTGSIGKTTVKTLTSNLLERKAPGICSQRSFNNHIGVPYTICNANLDHAWAVLEMGMNHAGELDLLSKLARPTLAVITKIAPTHMEFFSSLAEIADAKFEIANGLAADGVLLLNADDSELMKGFERWKKRHAGADLTVKTFGTGANCDFKFEKFSNQGLKGVTFEISDSLQSFRFQAPLLGAHSAWNAAISCVLAKMALPDLSWPELAETLAGVVPPEMRMNVVHLARKRTLIDDSYNANPVAMRAAVDVLVELCGNGGRAGAVLGEMAELGEDSERYHAELGAWLKDKSLSFLIAVGNDASLYLEELGPQTRGLAAEDAQEAAEILAEQNFDFVLVKGSRVVGLDRVVRHMKALDAGGE